MRIWLNRIEMDWYRCPIRLELVRHVIPLALFVFFIALALGYAWAREVFTAFPR